jgi:hypothetical protein
MSLFGVLAPLNVYTTPPHFSINNETHLLLPYANQHLKMQDRRENEHKMS